MPLILTHGWPGSIVEFLKLIGPLTDPVSFGGDAADSFDVVVPSLPGFGFSQKSTETGWTVSRIASAWVEPMKRLGYTRWAAQGGDWGAVVTTTLGAMQPEGLLGIHLNTQYAFPAQIPDTLSPEQRYAVETLALYTGDLGGSNHLQGTKPETVGFALADSPAGQAAWIYEKFQSKTDNHGLAEDALSIDDMLDAISLYWFTNSAAATEYSNPHQLRPSLAATGMQYGEGFSNAGSSLPLATDQKVAVQRGTAPYTGDRPRVLVQLEPDPDSCDQSC